MEAATIITAVAALISALGGLFAGVKWGGSRERKARQMRIQDERTRQGAVEGSVQLGDVQIHVRSHNPPSAEAVLNLLQGIDPRSLPR